MNKKQRAKFQEVINRACTVAQLIDYLKTLPPDLRVGVAGHFGEFHPMDIGDFFYHPDRSTFVLADGDWRHDNPFPMNFLEVTAPDIGEEPD